LSLLIPNIDSEINQQAQERPMKILGLAAAAVLLVSGSALAASATSDRPIVLAEEGGISFHLGDRDHEHDRDVGRRHKIVVIHDNDRHHDRDKDREHHKDHDKDHDKDRDHH
jgi:hypothetical protein